jgi:dynein heavy chain
MSLFDLRLKRRLVLDEFKSKEESAITQMLYHLKGAWIEDLIKVIKTNFSMVGKGWFNMQETSKITYDFGKLKRFLTVVRLMMQDTVLSVVKRCFHEFRDYIAASIPKRVNVLNACEVTNHYLTEEEERTLNAERKHKLEKARTFEPLFYVDLVKTKDDEFGFSTNPEKFVTMIRGLF